MAPSSNNTRTSRGSATSNPIDGETASRVVTECDEERSYHSDCSVGDITETSISDETPSERNKISALTASLVDKQHDISQSFATMVTKMAALINEKETENERLSGQSESCVETNKEKRQDHTDKCTKAVNSMAKKQAKIAKQFEKIIQQLEEENRQKDLDKAQLKKQISEMKDRMQKMKIAASRNGSRRSGLSRPPLLPTPRNSSQHCGFYNNPNDSATQITETFSITEISFKSTIVDIAEMTKNLEHDNVSINNEEGNAGGDNVRLIL